MQAGSLTRRFQQGMGRRTDDGGARQRGRRGLEDDGSGGRAMAGSVAPSSSQVKDAGAAGGRSSAASARHSRQTAPA